MVQTGHTFDRDNFRDIAKDYALTPVKPTLDGEPGYEDHPSGFKAQNGYLDAGQVRKFAYWALFTGACGHTYGCHDIWQMWQPGRAPITSARTPWREALKLPGSTQVGYARALMESRPYFTRVPDQALLKEGPAERKAHVAVTSDRNADGQATFIMAYLPTAAPVVIDTGIIPDAQLAVWWFDPRTGTARKEGEMPNAKTFAPRPPTDGDWVLVLDAPSAKHPTPGMVPWRK